MKRARLVLSAWWLTVVFFPGRPAAAGDFDPVGYELLPGSVIVDDCAACERPAIEMPLTGTFIATRLPVKIVGELYSLTGIQLYSPFSESGAEYVVKGSGTLHRMVKEPDLQTLTLDLTVNDAKGIQLTSGQVEAGSGWPAMDLRAAEDGSRDPARLYTIHLVAAPSKELVAYQLEVAEPPTFQGSFFIDDCKICARPTVLIPIGGSFLLEKSGGGGPNPVTKYYVKSLDLRTVNGPSDYHLAGLGTYEWGGEVALLQSMDLTVSVNEEEGVILSSGRTSFPDGVKFPDLEIGLEHQNPKSQVHVYSLQLVAHPVGSEAPPQFRRGDANGDASVDVSDPVFILFWEFAGGEAPGCLDAADTDANGQHEITDAVVVLDYLFLGGPAPPAPGPTNCGPARAPVFGCDSSPCR